MREDTSSATVDDSEHMPRVFRLPYFTIFYLYYPPFPSIGSYGYGNSVESSIFTTSQSYAAY
jgi:hypothetical protein